MNRNHYVQALRKNEMTENKYPKPSMYLTLVLIYLAPFVSSVLAYIAFVICVYRVVRYDARVFAVDYCLLVPIARLFSTSGGFTLLIWLCLFAGVWYVVLRGIRSDATYVFLIILLNYLILRMQMEIGKFVLCFGQMFMLCVVVPLQDKESAERAVKAFCVGLIVSSLYAFLLRDTWQIRAIKGNEYEAIWGTGIMRFSGLIKDPNYYMTLMLTGLAALSKLKECRSLSSLQFWSMGAALTLFGVFSYSKTFLLVLILFAGMYIIWQFWERKIFSGSFLIILAVAAAYFLLFSKWSPFAVVVERLRSANNFNELTTGRSEIYIAYWRAITEDIVVFWFGKGLAAKELFKPPHNLYLEIAYYLGTIGLILFVGSGIAMIRLLQKRVRHVQGHNIIAKYVVLIVVLSLFMTLHGMFEITLYGEFFVVFLSLLLVKKQPDLHVVRKGRRFPLKMIRGKL